MAAITNKTDLSIKSELAGRRLYLALRVKGITRTPKGLFADEEWIKRKLPKTAKTLSAWFEAGIPFYSVGKSIRTIPAIAEYFRVPAFFFTDKEKISDEKFLDEIIRTPTVSELISEKNNTPHRAKDLPPLQEERYKISTDATGKAPGNELKHIYEALADIFHHDNSKKQSGFFENVLIRKIKSDISNYKKSDFIEISNIHQIPLTCYECHDFIYKSFLTTSYAAPDQWVNHPNSTRIFKKEAALASRGIAIRRIYIYDTDEELQLLLKSKNILFQIQNNIRLKFIGNNDIQNFYYIKDIIAGIEVTDAGLIDDSWLLLAYLDINRNPIKFRLSRDLNKLKEYRFFLNELWHISSCPKDIL